MTTREILLTGCLLISGSIFAQEVPLRISVVPGLSTAGKSDEHITSKFSFNILGGKTGSVQGVEVGGLFNIDKKNTEYAQAAGLFNMTGGSVKGVQAAGIFNTVRGTLTGIQLGGIANYVKKTAFGIQIAGIYNHASDKLNGAQIAGISNYTQQNLNGIQLAGLVNVSIKGIAGVQVSGIFNYAKHLKGLQIGLINISDTSEGYAIGLINIVRKGYHKISLSANEVLNANLSYRTGNTKLYNILMVGVNTGTNNKIFTYGYGIGHEFAFGKKFSVNPELTCQYLYLGDWYYTNLLSKLTVQFNFKLSKNVALFAGPSFAAYYSDQPGQVKGYKFQVPTESYHAFDLWGHNTIGWIGWNAGVTFF